MGKIGKMGKIKITPLIMFAAVISVVFVSLLIPASRSFGTEGLKRGIRGADSRTGGLTGNQLDKAIISASRKYGIPLPFLIAVMRAESGFNINALSVKGAVGLMQVMPETGRKLDINIQNPLSNIIAGAKYLHYCLKRFGFKPVPALACYNAGPGSVRTVHIKKRPGYIIPPYRQTQIYIITVYKYYDYYRKLLH
jgi:soluble lytic murein transglycosylase-like protein